MLQDIKLRTLTEKTSPDRCFLTLYMDSVKSLDSLEKQALRMARSLETVDGEAVQDERNHLQQNLELVRKYLQANNLQGQSICIFACWLLDFVQGYELPVNVPEMIHIDSSPYVRPIAELQEEYENVAVVVADNKKAKIYVIASAVACDAKTIHGNVKNHVRKGGWSQQRYERRRDKQLLHYSKEIVQRLQELGQSEDISHFLLAGGKEIIQEIERNMPPTILAVTAHKVTDLGKGDAAVNEDIMNLFMEMERQSEVTLWEKIRSEYLKNGLGVVGIHDVFTALKEGRVETMIVIRDFKPEGRRCRDCEEFMIEPQDRCTACGSESVFHVDVVEELVEMVSQSGGETDFCDPMDSLKDSGSIAALLRWR